MKLGDRMKKYESASVYHLTDRLPIVIRVDGKAFSSYTKGLSKNDPFVMAAMDNVAKALCAGIMGARLAYVQSDEISVLVNPWSGLNSQSWFDNNLIKMVSISASIASAVMTAESASIFGQIKPACFDSRAFVLPFEEVTNCFIWRQQDAVRNSIQVLAQMNYSHKELHGLNVSILKEKLKTEKGIDWEAQPTRFKHGACIVRKTVQATTGQEPTLRSSWVVDSETPDFIQDRRYIEDRMIPVETL